MHFCVWFKYYMSEIFIILLSQYNIYIIREFAYNFHKKYISYETFYNRDIYKLILNLRYKKPLSSSSISEKKFCNILFYLEFFFTCVIIYGDIERDQSTAFLARYYVGWGLAILLSCIFITYITLLLNEGKDTRIVAGQLTSKRIKFTYTDLLLV